MPRKIASVFFLISMLSLSLFAEEVSYSHVDSQGIALDEKLVRLLKCTPGVFIEAGAHNGLSQSNTARLEKQCGWTGILVEPSASLFSALRANRARSVSYQCALGSFDEHGTYVKGDFDGGLMSSVDSQRTNRPANHTVLVRSLQSILDENRIAHVNFMSLDTEGYELRILKGIDFSRATFDYLLIEIYSRDYEAIVTFLSEKGYDLLENFSNYSSATNPLWDTTHNDYLFKRR